MYQKSVEKFCHLQVDVILVKMSYSMNENETCFCFQGSMIFANILHVHYDSEYWPNPEEFNPDRFIDSETKTFKANERLIPFSIGKRYCLGQSLAEKEYFLFFAGLLQKFQFQAVKPLPKYGRESGTIQGTLRTCPHFNTIIKKRNT